MGSFVPLRSGKRFSELYRTRRKRSGGIILLQAPGEGELPRVGVVAGRNVGNAVKRNRAKRRIREALHRVELKQDKDYVVIASPEVLDVTFGKLTSWISTAIYGVSSEKER